jgi:hypothetical protein
MTGNSRTKALCLAIAEAVIDQAIAEHAANHLAREIAKCGPTLANGDDFESIFGQAIRDQAGKAVN